MRTPGARSGSAPSASAWRSLARAARITTRDPDTGEQIDPYEPLRTLQRFHRARDGSAIFGQHLIPDNAGTVGIGDKVEVLSAGASNLM